MPYALRVRCAHCTHWIPVEDHVRQRDENYVWLVSEPGWGRCELAYVSDGKHDHPESKMLVSWGSDEPRSLSVATRADFGCVQHRFKGVTATP